MTSTTVSTDVFAEVAIERHPSGMEVVYRQTPHAPRQALLLTFYGGNRIESVAGLADLVDGLLTQGTHTRSAEEVAIAIDSIPMDLDIDTHRDYTSVSAIFMPEDSGQACALLGELLFQSTLADWEKEKVKTRGEISMQLDSPATLARDMFSQAIYENLPYKATLQNMLEALDLIQDKAVLQSHYERVFHPGNTRLVAVGPLSKEAVYGAIDALLAISVSHQKPTLVDEASTTTSATIEANRYVTIERNDSQQMHIVQGWFAPHYTHEDFPAMVVLNTVLGGAGLSSRLFTEIRDKQGLAYNVRSTYDAARYIGMFTLYIGTEPKNRERALAGFAEECRKLRGEALTANELNDAIENVLGRYVIFLERASQQALYLGGKMACGASIEQLRTYRQRIQAITSDDVQRAAQRYLSQPSIVSAVGPAAFL